MPAPKPYQRDAVERLASEKPGARGLRDAAEEVMTHADAVYIAETRKQIESAETVGTLRKIVAVLVEKNVNIRNALRPDYKRRLEEMADVKLPNE